LEFVTVVIVYGTEVINPEHEVHGKMLHNESHKHESIFTSVTAGNKSVMLSTLAGSTLEFGLQWRRKIQLTSEDKYNIVAKYGYEGYPANPNGSDFNTAMLCDTTGRHLVMMPHIERSTFHGTAHYQRIETMKFHLGMKPCECQKMDR
jgi:phosphoribosylformylglycinamidine synthase